MPIPLNKKVTNYDATLAGKLINYVENPDSVGYQGGKWYSPMYDRRYDAKKKNYDIYNFGMGIDKNKNEYLNNGLIFHKDKLGREYLTEQEERNARHHSIANAEESYENRVKWAQKTLKSDKTPSEMKKALTISAIYNLGQGTVANELFEDRALMNAFINGTDLEYSNHVNRYYIKHKKGDRGEKTNNFISENSKADGGQLTRHKFWHELSQREKAEMMRVAIDNGITSLPEIRQKYNEFAEGGPEDDKIYEQGSLPEVLISPSLEDKQVVKTMKDIFPAKYSRNEMYQDVQKELDFLGNQQAMNDALSKLQELHYASGNPRVTIQKGPANLLPWSIHDANENVRAHYISTPFGETMYLPSGINLDNYVAELSHAAQFHHPTIQKDFKYLRGKYKPEAYFTPGTTEYNAHRIIEPAILNYVLKPSGDDNTFYQTLINSEIEPGVSPRASKVREFNAKNTADLRRRVENYYANQQSYGGPLVEMANKYAEGGPEENELSLLARAGIWAATKLGLSSYMKGKDTDEQYRQNLYNRVDPTDQAPKDLPDMFWRLRDVVRARIEKQSEYNRSYEDPVANAGWAKRLGLPYDKTQLVDNSDGSVRLPAKLEAEIPTDTTFLKNRIATNKRLQKRYGKTGGLNPDRQLAIEAGLKADSIMLDGLRKAYNNPGDAAVVNEHSFVNRRWLDDGVPNMTPSPLNILGNYSIYYDKDKNTLNYYDVYDFNAFEPFVPGHPYNIKGSIKLNK